MILGVISAVDNANGLKVQIDGETSPSTKKYSYLTSYVPSQGDRVLIEEINGSYVILGKLCTDIEQSGIVRQAENATNAVNAVNAQNATNAVNATNATTAASCSGNAATATTAAECSGNSATATTATNLKDAYSVYGSVVYNVTRTYNSQIASYIVTDISLQGPHNFLYKN